MSPFVKRAYGRKEASEVSKEILYSHPSMVSLLVKEAGSPLSMDNLYPKLRLRVFLPLPKLLEQEEALVVVWDM